MNEKDFYREQIIEMVQKIDIIDILEYFYIFIKGKVGRKNDE